MIPAIVREAYRRIQSPPLMKGTLPPLIICFGDSLTAGFQSPSRVNPTGEYTPYGAFLQQRLGTQARVAISGICGELTGEMVMRFRRDVLEHPPEWVIILGGTNDLGWNATPSAVMGNLVKMYEQARAANIRLIPVTIPSIRVDPEQGRGLEAPWIADHIRNRSLLNRLIKEYAESKGLAWFDLFSLTAEPDTHQLAAGYSNDGLHLTTEGYQRFAEGLSDTILASHLASRGSGAT